VNRFVLAGGVFAYLTSFKYVPVLVLPYFLGRRWWRAVGGYAAGVAVLGVATEVLFGVSRFFNNNVPDIAASQWSALQSTTAFCDVWMNPESHRIAVANQTFAGIRWGLCSLHDRHPWLHPPLLYLLLCLAIGAAALVTFVRLERLRRADDVDERWRRLLELGLVIAVYTTFFHTHYYYLCVLIVPLTALLFRLTGDRGRRPVDFALWGAAYVLLGALVLPASTFSWLFQRDLWPFYMGHALYVYGELLLIALLLREYRALAIRSAMPAAVRMSTIGMAGSDWRASVSNGK
jgi:hypothetical protein